MAGCSKYYVYNIVWSLFTVSLLGCEPSTPEPTPPAPWLAGAPAPLSPENRVCDASGDPRCEAKDEDASLLLAADATIFITWLSNREGRNADIFLMRSTVPGVFGEPVRVTTHEDSDGYPTLIEASTARGRFHL